MPNKNIQEPIEINLIRNVIHEASSWKQTQKQSLNSDGCQCPVCKKKLQQNYQTFLQKQKDDNCLHQFLKEIPSIFPLSINPTTVINFQQGYHMNYSNGSKTQNKSYIYKTKTSKLTSNFPISHNIRLFGNNFSKIVAKYEIMSFIRKLQQKPQSTLKKKLFNSLQKPLNPEQRQKQSSSTLSKKGQSKLFYIQSYSHQIPIKVYYDKTLNSIKLDDILREYLDQQTDTFQAQKSYSINEEFWQWVFTQYGQQVFAYFVTQFYCRAYHFFSQNIIHQGIFYWIFQKPKSQFGDHTKVTEELGKHKSILQAQYFIAKSKKLAFKVKLANIKNIKIQFHQNLRSFQEEYQDLILGMIKSVPEVKPQNKLLGSNASNAANKKNYVYQNRLDTFQSKVRNLFLKEQNKVLNQVESEKQFQGKQDSNKLARLLLPNMGEYQSIRQILNDQFAFQKLVMFQQRKKQKQRLKRARQSLLGQHRGQSSEAKHIYQQSRIKRKQNSSKRIRIRTQY